METSAHRQGSAALPRWKRELGAVLRLRRGPIAVPENHHPISSSLLLTGGVRFSTARTAALLPPCALARARRGCWGVHRARNRQTGQQQIYICTCNLKSARSHVRAPSDRRRGAGEMGETRTEFAGKDMEGPV